METRPPYSEKLFDPTALPLRYVIHQGGTRSGKTYTIAYYLLAYAFKHPGTCISIVSESLPHLKRGVIRDLMQIIAKEGWKFAFEENKTDHIFTSAEGSMIECFAAESDSKLRGAKRDILFINECNNVSYHAFDELDVRTRQKTILDFNPVKPFWVHNKLIPMLKESEYVLVKSTYRDNEYLNESDINNIERRRVNETWWKVYGEGETGEYEGNVFTNWDIVGADPGVCPSLGEHMGSIMGEHTGSIQGEHTGSPLPGKLLGYGVDFGFVRSATAVVQVNELEGEYYVKEIFYKTGAINDEVIEAVSTRIDLQKRAIADSADPRTIYDLQRKGWRGLQPAFKGPDSVRYGLKKMLDTKIHITADSKNLINEFQNYVWAKDPDGRQSDMPVKDYDDGIDAIRYLISAPPPRTLICMS